MFSISFPVTGPIASTAPRLVDAVVGSSASGGSEFGCGIDDAGDECCDGEVAVPAGCPVQDTDETDLLQGAEDGGDMSVWGGIDGY